MKLIIFDFDGTLADTNSLVLKLAKEKFDEFEFDVESIESIKKKGLVKTLADAGVSYFKMPSIISDLQEDMYQRIGEVKFFPGTETLVKKLKKEGFILTILTHNKKKTVERFLKEHQIDIFSGVYDTSIFLKKHRKIKKIIKKHRLTKEETLVVGDQPSDIMAGKMAKTKTVAVDWGLFGEDALLKAEPDKIVSDPFEIYDFIIKESLKEKEK